MQDTAIRTDGLGKRYPIGQRERYLALRDVVVAWTMAPFGGLGAGRRASEGHVWALKDVGIEIASGTATGIIGRNGAGKTTLLKILARVTRPTEGAAHIYGRVGSLLEVGTGFHPELTGRENVFLSAAIHGMRKREIVRKFDEIVQFSGVERFIDTPLKRFSNGMQMRLAFAVAAHLEPDILVVDEVLAVGDMEFQRKCMGKMEDVSKGGRTVLFVSHQMNQIRRLCENVIWLDGGKVRQVGPTPVVLAAYETAVKSRETNAVRQTFEHEKARVVGWEIVSPPTPGHVLESEGPVVVRFTLDVSRPFRVSQHGIALTDSEGRLVWGWATGNFDVRDRETHLDYRFPGLPLRPGVYSWRVSLFDDEGLVDDWECLPQMIIATMNHQHHLDQWNGYLNLPCEFALDGKVITP